MKGLNNPIGMKSLEPSQSPFIMNAFRFGGSNWATALVDWLKRKEITINGAAKTADFTDDFATDNWTNIEGTNVGVSGGVLAYDAGAGAGDDGEYRDYGSVLSNTFVWRFKWNATNLTVGTNLANNEVNISISSNVSNNATANDAVGFLQRTDSANISLNAGIWDNTAPSATASTNTSLTTSGFTAGIYYGQIIRHSNRKFTFTLYTDSDFSEVKYTTTLTNSADLLDLRYFKVTTDHETSADSTNNGSFDDFNLWDGVTTVENIPSQQTAEAKFGLSGTKVLEDFADDGWTDSTSSITVVNTGTGVLDWDANKDGSHDATHIDLGADVSETAWVLRGKIIIDARTNTSVSSNMMVFGLRNLSDVNSNSEATQDGIFFRVDGGTSLAGSIMYVSSSTGTGLESAVGNSILSGYSTATPYYFELIRNSAILCTVNIYSDSSFSTLIEKSTDVITSSINGLRYLICTKRAVSSVGGSLNGTIDDVQFWNNVTEVNPATLTDYPLPIVITGDADLMEKTTET
jgi:hypothetical protein